MDIKGKAVNRAGLAEILGVSLPTVDSYVKRGCPYVSQADRDNGVPWVFDTAEVIEWLKDDYRREHGSSLYEWGREAAVAGLSD